MGQGGIPLSDWIVYFCSLGPPSELQTPLSFPIVCAIPSMVESLKTLLAGQQPALG